MSAGYEATVFLEIEPADYYRNATHIDSRVVRATLAPPRRQRPGTRIVKMVVELPAIAFEPPEVRVSVSARALRGRARAQASVVEP